MPPPIYIKIAKRLDFDASKVSGEGEMSDALGKAGAGFSFVADEIRQLAERTAA